MNKYKLILALVLVWSGFAILASVDWKTALGVFLFVWGNNIAESRK